MLEELLEVLAAGSQQQKQQAPAKNPLMDLLEGVLGGSPQQPQPKQSSGGMGDILEAVLGGGARSGQGQVASNPMLTPFVNGLSEKLGISPQMAAVIVSAAFGMIVSKTMSGMGNKKAQTKAEPTSGMDLDDLLDGDFIDKSGVAERVAKQTGMGKGEAADSLRKAMEMLGVLPKGQSVPKRSTSRRSAPAKTTTKGKSGDMKGLLDTWQIG